MSGGTDDSVLATLTECHERLSATLTSVLVERATGDEAVRADLDAWASALGVDEADSVEGTAERVAGQVVSRLIVDRLYADGHSAAGTAVRTSESFGLGRSITETVVDDHERVLDHDDIDTALRLGDIADGLDQFVAAVDRSAVGPAVLGRCYERALPADRRSDQGEFYTPPVICDLLSRLTVRNADDTVLDPACGAGGLLVAAFDHKQALAAGSPTDASVEQLTGIDVNRYPTRLSVLALADRASADPAAVDVRASDFFDVTPTEGFDAVVGNPPYVRGRSLDLDDKDRIRAHLPAVDAEWLTRKMDLYGYFLTHATQFLCEGGRLGFVVSDRWLDTQYGTDLQRFVLDNYRIEAVIAFRQQSFDDALVGSTAVVLEAESDPTARADNTATFLDVRAPCSVDEIATLVERDTAADQLERTDSYRLATVEQRRLRDLAKWNALFLAPPLYFDLRSDRTVELSDRAALSTGLESGANDFFYRRWDDIEGLGLTDHFTPLLKASGQIDRIRFEAGSTPEWGVFDVSDLVERARAADARRGESAVEHVKGWLAANGYDAVSDYVQWGEDEGHHDGSRRCRRRDVWFAIDDLDRHRPPLALPLFTWRQSRTVWNDGGVTDRQFHGVAPRDGVDPAVLCGLLNSRAVWLAREIDGRHAGGRGMTRLQLVKYEAGGLPIPDPTALSADERAAIVAALDDLVTREATLDADGVADPAARRERTEDERDALDRAVLAPLGMADRLDELKTAVRALVTARTEAAGDGATMPVCRTDGRAVGLWANDDSGRQR